MRQPDWTRTPLSVTMHSCKLATLMLACKPPALALACKPAALGRALSIGPLPRSEASWLRLLRAFGRRILARRRHQA